MSDRVFLVGVLNLAFLKYASRTGAENGQVMQMNVYVTPKDNNLLLKVSLGDKSDITRVMKLPPTTLVRDVWSVWAIEYGDSERIGWAGADVEWGVVGVGKHF